MAELKPGARLPLLFFGMLSLLGGVMAGLARLGWDVPGPAVQAAGVHGPLMIAAFFGTVISLERAVAVGHNWAYLAPLAAGLGGVALLAGMPTVVGQTLGSLAALGLIAASVVALRRQVAAFTIVLTAGRRLLADRQPVLAGRRRPDCQRGVVAALPGPDHCRRTAGVDPLPADAAARPEAVHRHCRRAVARRH
jgi:hypothetical protein